jgi:hypothetical protein
MSDGRAQIEAQSETAAVDKNSSAEETSWVRKKVHLHELVSFFFTAAHQALFTLDIRELEKWKTLANFTHG